MQMLQPLTGRNSWLTRGKVVPLTKYRPGAVITPSGWTGVGGTLVTAINEVIPSSAEYDQSALNPSGDVLEEQWLNIQAPPVGDNHTWRYMLRGTAGTESVTAAIIAGDGATIVKSVVHNPLPVADTVFVMVFTAAQCAAWAAAGYPGSRFRLTAS